MKNRRPWTSAFALATLLGSPTLAAAQEIPDIDYENLSFRGFGFDWGWMEPEGVEATSTWALRFDLGYAGPGLRIVPSVSYWKAPLEAAEIEEFATRIEELVFDQTGQVATLDLGTIEYSDVAIGIDGHVVWEVPFDLLTYMGLGLTAHILNGSGSVIEETFVDDLFDSVAPGFNLHLGAEYPVSNRFRVYTVGRYEVMPDFRHFRAQVGWQIMTGPNAPGEGR